MLDHISRFSSRRQAMVLPFMQSTRIYSTLMVRPQVWRAEARARLGESSPDVRREDLARLDGESGEAFVRRDIGNKVGKTDDTDLFAMHRAGVNGFGLLEQAPVQPASGLPAYKADEVLN